MNNNNKAKILYIITSCEKTGPTQQLLNIIKGIDRNVFDVKAITVYQEEANVDSLFAEYEKQLPITCIPTSKIQMMLGLVPQIKRIIKEYSPDVIHTSGVFPDYMVSRLGTKKHVLTSRNFVYDDYVSRYGFIRGNIMAKMQLYALTNTPYSRVCSDSLHNIYANKIGLSLPVIRNGVDIEKYNPCDDKTKIELRRVLNLPLDANIIVYGAGFNERKNHEFLLHAYVKSKCFNKTVLLLLGRGQFYAKYKKMYEEYKNILMLGPTVQMNDYLRASDYYVSTSKSEGLPNGVIEALATGLPVVLSDIPQHCEIVNIDNEIGYLYKSGDVADFSDKMEMLLSGDKQMMKKKSREIAEQYFSSIGMSKKYQDLYKSIIQDNQE